jgi:hypothetical protein
MFLIIKQLTHRLSLITHHSQKSLHSTFSTLILPFGTKIFQYEKS